MEPIVFRKLSQIARDTAGISLRPGKETLLASRIGKRLRALQLDNPVEYLQYLEDDDSGEEMIQFLDAISTNYTRFMREAEHFVQLREAAERWRAQKRSTIRLWCAASSTGEEPYTLAMVLHEVFEGFDADIRILATDISTRALATAREGVYPAEAVEPLPSRLLSRYFTAERVEASGEKRWRVIDTLKRMVVFKRLNLATPPFPMKGPLESVFCRNVMIYFEQRERAALISEIERLLAPGGLLYIGHAETLNNIATKLKRVAPSAYEKCADDDDPEGEP